MKALKEYVLEEAIDYSEDIKTIKEWIKDNCKVAGLTVSKKPNKNGKFTVNAAEVEYTNKSIESLTNGMFVWKNIKKFFYCPKCQNLTSLEGAPEKVGWTFNCNYCTSLTSLEGCPQEVNGMSCEYCTSLTSLEGCPKSITNDFSCEGCTGLTSLKGGPEKIYKGYFNCSRCTSLKNLEGGPKGTIYSFYNVSYCTSLTSLEGAPYYVIDGIYCNGCTSLKSRKGVDIDQKLIGYGS